jgi:hypothetical protein
MKNLYTRIAAFSFLVLFFAVSAQAQMEHPPLFDETYTELDAFPEALKNQQLPSIMATPNPATGEIVKVWYTQLSETSEVAIFDLSGKRYRHAMVGSATHPNGAVSFNITDLTSGIYLVRLRSGVHVSTAKIVVQ